MQTKNCPYPENKVVLTGGEHWSAEREKSARSRQAKFVEVDAHKVIFLSEYSSCFK